MFGVHSWVLVAENEMLSLSILTMVKIYGPVDIESGRVCLHALSLFVGEPVWTPYNRPQDENPIRQVPLKQQISLRSSTR